MTTTVMLSGGGTGGHIFPALALREELLRRHPGWNFVFVGTRRGLETELVPRAGVALEFIDIEGLIGRGLRSLRALCKLPGAISSAKKLLKKYSPKLVAGFGGYASFPLLWAASGMNLPTLIHESNLVPGFANRRLAGRVTARAASFSVTRTGWPDAQITGMPVRAAFAQAAARRAAQPGDFRLLIAGGSRGASGLNRMVGTDLDALLKIPGIRIRHQTGIAQLAEFATLYKGKHLPAPEPFIADMAGAMGDTELFVGRAGASTLAEITVAGLPALLVPFPAAAGDHQVKNARGLAQMGAAQLLEERDFHPGALAEKIAALRDQPETLQKMAAASRAAATPDAAAKLADLAEKIMGAGS
jgi:UDP-N-acetylglucosamine--N-acetylmuramyl-(pentapeptide) pyrophosphoryl-undecaprenol N-acetylglucosamine transferase